MAIADERRAEVDLRAEDLDVLERLITAPSPGRFYPAVREGAVVEPGEKIGEVIRSGETTMVVSPFHGSLMGLLVLPGERVRLGQAVAWLS